MRFYFRNIFFILSIVFGQSTFFPNFEIVTNISPYPSKMTIHLTSFDGWYMGIIDEDLEIEWDIFSGPLGFDFKVNQDKLSYYDKDNYNWIILDGNMVEVDTLSCADGHKADYHDIRLLPDGGYILQSYDTTFYDMSTLVVGGDPNARIFGLTVQEFDASHNLILEWYAWDRLDIRDYTDLILTAQTINWMHGNSIEVDFDEHLLISNRRSSEIIKIHRETGETIWHMGGPLNEFTFINDPLGNFKKQHDARRLDNGNITLFDNGTTHDVPLSRAVEYSVNEEEMTAELVWSFTHPDNLVGLSMGSVQRLPNDNTLINWGNIAGQGTIVTEVNLQGNIVLELRFPTQYHTYKVRKNDWTFHSNLIIGDTNQDHVIDIFDLNYIIDFQNLDIQKKDVFHLFRVDINRDGEFNLDDVYHLAGQILTNP